MINAYHYIVVSKTKGKKATVLSDKLHEDKGAAENELRKTEDPSQWRVKRVTDAPPSSEAKAEDNPAVEEPVFTKPVKPIDRTPGCDNCKWNLLSQFPESNSHNISADIACSNCTGETRRKGLAKGKRMLPKFSNFASIPETDIGTWWRETANPMEMPRPKKSKDIPFETFNRGDKHHGILEETIEMLEESKKEAV